MAQKIPEKEIKGFTYPCAFAVKAMGLTEPELEPLILAMVQRHAPEVTEKNCRCKLSKNGKYTSVTVTFEAQSKEQMDKIYHLLSAHDKVLHAL